jgi:3-oxoacyl-[acyl-carrier-protein] synthase III
LNIKIEKIEYYLPENLVTNKHLQKQNPSWDMLKAVEKSGVHERYFADENETAFDLACKACDKLFHNSNIKKEDIDGIIFCTQSPDYIMPSNAFLLHNYLGLPNSTFAFDYNLACSGYVYGIALAKGFMSIGIGSNILLVTGDTYSKYVNKKDRSARILFGDGAAASFLTKNKSNAVFDIALESSGKDHKSFYIPAGGCRLPKSKETSIEKIDQSNNVHTLEDIHMNGFGVWKFIASTVPKQIKALIEKNNYTLDDIDLFILHQSSKMTIDSLVKNLKIKDEKVYTNISKKGNLVSSSIPVAIKDAEEEGKLKRGDLILLSGFGVGLSYGTILMKY